MGKTSQEEVAEKMHIDRSVVAKIIKIVQKLKLQDLHIPDSITLCPNFAKEWKSEIALGQLRIDKTEE